MHLYPAAPPAAAAAGGVAPVKVALLLVTAAAASKGSPAPALHQKTRQQCLSAVGTKAVSRTVRLCA
jgi:hypothetical protein